MDYGLYLRSGHWKEIREKKLASCPHCQLCGSTGKLHVHHKRYSYYETERLVKIGKKKSGSILWNEINRELFVLCSRCHRLWHAHYGKKYITHKIAHKIRRLIKMGVQPKYAFIFSLQTDAYNGLLKLKT